MSSRLRIDDANRRWWILAATGGSLGIVLLDETMVGVALPTIRDELGLSQLLAQWVVNAYVLALTVFVAAAGRLGDIFGHRPVFIAGAAILGAGALVSGLAGGGAGIIVGRAVQGLGSAAILSLGIAMTGIVFSVRERGLGLGIYGVIGAAAAAVAPFLGGVLTDLASWRWIFLLNLPLVTAVIAIISLSWREPEGATEHTSLDIRGLVLLPAFLVPLVLALMQGPEWGWGSMAVVGLLTFSAVTLVLFVSVERRSPDPLIDLGLLRLPTLVGANLVIFCAQFSKMAVIVFGALFLQDRLGMSPLLAGTALLAAFMPTLLTSVWSGSLTDRRGSRLPTLVGVAVTVASLLWLAILLPAERYLLLLPGLFVWGAALSFLFTPPQTAIMNSVAARKRGEAAGIASTGRQLGGALAVATLGAVFVGTGSFAAVFWIAAGVTAVVWVAGLVLIERPDRGGAEPAGGTRSHEPRVGAGRSQSLDHADSDRDRRRLWLLPLLRRGDPGRR
jgi:EmrB/QacA subfamily drug resistance transporter